VAARIGLNNLQAVDNNDETTKECLTKGVLALALAAMKAESECSNNRAVQALEIVQALLIEAERAPSPTETWHASVQCSAADLLARALSATPSPATFAAAASGTAHLGPPGLVLARRRGAIPAVVAGLVLHAACESAVLSGLRAARALCAAPSRPGQTTGGEAFAAAGGPAAVAGALKRHLESDEALDLAAELVDYLLPADDGGPIMTPIQSPPLALGPGTSRL
jgi:hypothetical protein